MADTADEFDDFDTLPLIGIPIASTDESTESPSDTNEQSDNDHDRPMLIFRDADVPGRDFQPRLLRFGEAA